MNLYDPLPCCAGEYEVHTDFRFWLEFGEASEKDDIVGMLKVFKQLPPDLETAVSLACKFYAGAALPYGGGKSNKNIKSTADRTVDFLYDSQLIYAAFMAQYGINLSSAKLHWYEFCALFYGLNGQKINDICGYRGADTQSIEDSKRRREAKRLKRLYALPDNRTPARRDRENTQNLAKMF